MERNYRPLRPASGIEARGPQNTQPEENRTLTRNQKRPGFACNACRTRKTACDRKQPRCTACAGRSIRCVYQTESKAEEGKQKLRQEVEWLRRQHDQHVELIDQFITLPEHEAIEILQRLRATRDIGHVIAFMKGSMLSRPRPFERMVVEGSSSPAYPPLILKLIANQGTIYLTLTSISTENLEAGYGSEAETIDLHNAPSTDTTTRSPSWDDDTALEQDGVNTLSSGLYFEQPPSPLQSYAKDNMPPAVPLSPRQYYDDRLYRVEIGFWTKVNIGNELAASVISFFLETEHSIWGCFDADLFLTDLVERRERFCSPFLVNSLLWFACQLYTSVDIRALAVGYPFFEEAEKLWRQESNEPNVTTLAASQILSIGCNIAGKDELARELVHRGRQMAEHLGLFGVVPDCDLARSLCEQDPEWRRAAAHAAWGTYNWYSLHCFYYYDEPIWHAPSLPIPRSQDDDEVQMPPHVSNTFPSLCRFWSIAQEVAALYHNAAAYTTPFTERVPLSLVEAKYQKLLNWADTLVEGMEANDRSPAHALLFHGLFHSLVLQIFRQYVTDVAALNRTDSFSSMDGSLDEVYAASTNQLKRGIYLYFSEHKGTPFSVFYNVGLLQLSHALLKDYSDHDWRVYVQVCIRAWTQVLLSYRIYSGITQTFLSVALRDGAFTSGEAHELMTKMKHAGRHHEIIGEQPVSMLFTDMDQIMTDATEPRLGSLADQFDDLVMFNEFTTGEYDVTRNSTAGTGKSIEGLPDTWKGKGVDGKG